MDVHNIRKYNIPGPRYTSYPTVPYWNKIPSVEEWTKSVKQKASAPHGISIYIHLPYCESLCTYCGCNTRISVNHAVEKPYISSLLREWQLYLRAIGKAPIIREIHLGGGTPTFFSPENLAWLINEIKASAQVHPQAEFSFEAHPQNTTKRHLSTLFDVGFRRLSLGIQDFDPRVQKVINRVQDFEMVEKSTEEARKIGYTSVNFDLIYGLPLQTTETVEKTIKLSNQLRPDRIAYYSYAHVPWLKPGQRSFTEKDLPEDEEKRKLYELGKLRFEEEGYIEIGMDHFALPSDSLSIAMKEGKLHRNFMGYTHQYTPLMIGLGASSISDSWDCFIQNRKTIEEYQRDVEHGILPYFRGHQLAEEDLIIRQHILNIMCRFETSWETPKQQCEAVYLALEYLKEMEKDGLIEIAPYNLKVTEAGKPFVRNVCMAFDAKMHHNQPEQQVFSKVV